MTKWNGILNELVDELVELMKRDKKEAQDKIRKQEIIWSRRNAQKYA